MAVTIKHAKTDNIANWTQADLDAQIALGNYPAGTVLADIVLPSDWNNDHTISGTVPIANGGTGQTTATQAINALLPSQTSNAGKVLGTDGTNTSWVATSGTGTVTSVGLTAPSIFSVAGSPVTASGTLALSYSGTALPVANGGTGQTTYTDGQLLIGNSTGNTLSKATLTAGSNITITNGAGAITIASTGGGGMTYPGAGIANSTGSAWGTSYTTTGTGTVVALQTAASLNNPTISNYADWGNGSATTLAAGRMWYNGSTGSWNLGMGNGNITQQVGEELFIYGKASSAITDSPLQIIYHTGTVGSSGVVTFAPTVAGITDGNAIIGVATENIALNGFGRITTFGVVRGINTSGSAFGETWADDDVIWYNPVTGNPTKVKPVAPNIKIQIGLVITAGSGGSGSFEVSIKSGSVLGGTDSNVQLTSPTNGQILTYDTSNTYWKNTSLTAGTGISVSAATGGTLTVSNSGVTSVTGTAPVVSSGGATPAISMAAASSTVNGYLTSTDWTTFNNKGSGTVTSVSATSPVTSTGGATPTIAMPAATTSVSGYLTSTDWTTFNNKGSGTVTSVAALTLGTTGTDLSSSVATGTTTPVITLNVPTASASNRGVLSSADWTTFNNKGSGTVTSASVVSANGFAGTVATATTTPAITISTSITGVLKGNGTAISAATSGTDYSAGTSALGTGILKSTTTTGALTIAVAADFPTLNQNTTGSAATLTTPRAIYGNNFDGSAALTQVIAGTYGGTGVNNGSNTITIAGNVTYSGAFTQTFTATGNTSVTLPTTGTLATLAGTETFTNKTLTGYTETVYAITDAAGVAISPTNGSIQTWTLGASRTPTAGTWASGQSMTLMIDDGTAFTVTWTTIGVTWVGGSAPTLATTGYTIIVLWKVGSTIYGNYIGSA